MMALLTRAALVQVMIFAAGASAATLGTRTITNATHYGYWGFASTSAHNTRTIVAGVSGVTRRIHVQGTLTKVHPAAWASSLRVHPTGGLLAIGQPWFQFTDLYDFDGTIPVSTTIYVPGGATLSSAMLFEMYSIDDEAFVPGVDGRSTLTYSFDDQHAPGTVEYNGVLSTSDPTFNRPQQVPTNPPGWSAPFLTNRFPHYDVQPFFVDTAGAYALASASEFQSAGVLYAGGFDPANPLSNLVRAQGQGPNVIRNNTLNNLPLGGDAIGGALLNVNLQPNVQYFFVTTAFSAPSASSGPVTGRYLNLITGAGNVTLGLIPEPSTGVGLSVMLSLCLRRWTAGPHNWRSEPSAKHVGG
ncbi:MAG: hypothetical protein NZ561_08925 [Phycisphaerae bacterium]|nr:hypothetical protein [Phycisphaerae bacterium]MDW8263325.1 hypothetical protein [Phycisphaerales bacterium]